MSAPAPDPITDVVRIGWSLAHPLRVRILAALLDAGPAAPAELAPRLGADLRATSHHCRALRDAGMLRQGHLETSPPPRGLYRIDPRWRLQLERLLADVRRATAAQRSSPRADGLSASAGVSPPAPPAR